MPKADCLKIQKRLAEKAIQLSKNLGLLSSNLKIARNDDEVLLPLQRKPVEKEQELVETRLGEAELTIHDFQVNVRKPRTLIDALEDMLPSYLLASLPRSIDILGKVAIIEVPPELKDYDRLIGEALFQLYPSLKTVLAKEGAVFGECRLRRYRVIAGTGETETYHKEYGCIYYLDPVKTYFSPRLSHEHRRVSEQVKEGEVVIDMFAGVGPFSIQIAKSHENVKVYAIDVNPDAIRFLKKNINANKVGGKVVPVLGDARETIAKDLRETANRVIMNLPGKAINFVEAACIGIVPEGGIIHYYDFMSESKLLREVEERLHQALSKTNRRLEKVIAERIVRPTAPHESQVALDVLVH